jgi:hypothetical protein
MKDNARLKNANLFAIFESHGIRWGVNIWGAWPQISIFDGLLHCAFAASLRFWPLGPRSVDGGQ